MGEERQGAKGHCLDGAEAHAAWRQRNIGLVQAFGHFSGVNNGSWKIVGVDARLIQGEF